MQLLLPRYAPDWRKVPQIRRTRGYLTLALGATSLAVFAACGTPAVGGTPAPSPDAGSPRPLLGSQAIATARAKHQGVPNQVVSAIVGVSFEDLTIKKGTTVVWINEDSHHHSVTAYDIHGNYDSGPLHTGDSFSHTFDGVGVSKFYCQHIDMEGTITVTP